MGGGVPAPVWIPMHYAMLAYQIFCEVDPSKLRIPRNEDVYYCLPFLKLWGVDGTILRAILVLINDFRKGMEFWASDAGFATWPRGARLLELANLPLDENETVLSVTQDGCVRFARPPSALVNAVVDKCIGMSLQVRASMGSILTVSRPKPEHASDVATAALIVYELFPFAKFFGPGDSGPLVCGAPAPDDSTPRLAAVGSAAIQLLREVGSDTATKDPVTVTFEHVMVITGAVFHDLFEGIGVLAHQK